jgi:DNA mismatch repair ATPase MutS
VAIKIHFVRSGDFFETFGEGALHAAAKLGRTLTKRRSDGAAACGVPAWSAESEFAELRESGFEVTADGA